MQVVHQFNAESNLICNLCTAIVDHQKEGNLYGINQLFEEFPALEQRFHQNHYFTEEISQFKKYSTSKEICSELSMCPSENLTFMYSDEPLNHQVHIDFVNSFNTTWKAGINDKFKDMSLYEVRKLLGTVVDNDWTVNVPLKYADSSINVPEQFSAFEKWPECKQVIGTINDQSNCGSCFSFSAGQALTDRICIASKGTITTPMSESDILGCCHGLKCMSYGCNGGQMSGVWRWFTTIGVVSGGKFEEDQYCYSYTMPSCNHHSSLSPERSCDTVTTVEPQCYNTCQDNKSIDYSSDKHLAKSHYKLTGVDAIKQDLFLHGSVSAGFTVYEDFLTYQSGVYQHISGDVLGGHGISVLGYGIEDGVEYWLAKNSWSENWGQQGYFKIKMGECGIEDGVYAGLV